MKGIAFLSGLISGFLTFGILPVQAQVTSDGTANTTVNTNGNNFTILNGIQRGNNLFHSFKEFSIPTGSSATFQNSSAIVNIINRVTGGNVSNIDGLIKANGSANLFLINPAGIVFGENASLNIGGSFFATTADSIVFSDNLEFSATNISEPPLLSINVPIGIQLGSNPGNIQIQGNGHNLQLDFDNFSPIRDNRPLGLQVPNGKTLALIGGDILFAGGNITANQGRVELGSVQQSGIVSLIPTTDGFTIDYGDIESFGNLSFTQASSVDVSGKGSGNLHFQAANISVVDASAIISNVLESDDGGNVLIRASESVEVVGTETGDFPSALFNQAQLNSTGNNGNLLIDTGRLRVANNAFISSSIAGTGNGGNLNITADEVEVADTTTIYPNYDTGLLSQVLSGGSGKGGDLTIEAENISFRDGTYISTNTNDIGNAGNLTINAKTIEVVGTTFDGSLITAVSADTFSTGQGGNLVINTDNLSVRDGGQLAAGSFGEGNGGNFIINANNIELTGRPLNAEWNTGLFVDTLSSGNGGNLIIETENLRIADGASILAVTVASGNAGNVTIRASELIEITGKNQTYNIFSTISSGTFNAGNGGNLIIETPNLRVVEGGIISSTTFGAGNAGSVEINANTVEISDAAVDFSNTLNGIVTFVAPETIDFNGNIVPPATGNGGNITINGNFLSLKNGGQIDASTFGFGVAGNINLNVNQINLAGISEILDNGTQIPSRIISASETDFAAGSININADQLSVNDGAEISVSGLALGDAGNLIINADTIKLNNQGNLQANEAAGKQGNITLDSNLLLLRNGSNITTNATRTANGGNITIDSPVIAGFENSDIIANAVQGNGGNIEINTQGIFGLQFRDELTPNSDITASSQFGINGMVKINNISIDPSSGLVELPKELVDSSQQIATGCSSNNDSTFVATGRGGIPQNPKEDVDVNPTWSDIRDLSTYRQQTNNTVENTLLPNQTAIVEATGFIRNAKGEIELVALENTPLLNKQIADCSKTNT